MDLHGEHFDPTDAQILSLLQKNARMSNAEIARRVDMAPSGVFERIRKLEERGVILGYEARLDAKALGYGLCAFIFVRADDRPGTKTTADLVAKIPEVQEVHHIAGEDCFLVKARAADAEDLGRLLRDHFGSIASIRSTKTTIVLGTSKESSAIPTGSEAGGAERRSAAKNSNGKNPNGKESRRAQA